MSTTPKLASIPSEAAKKKPRKRLFLILGGVVLLVLLIVAAVVKGSSQEKPVAVTTDKAVTKTITHLVTATGKVQPEVEVKISPEVAGELVAIAVQEGQLVKKNDLLVRIKPDFYK